MQEQHAAPHPPVRVLRRAGGRRGSGRHFRTGRRGIGTVLRVVVAVAVAAVVVVGGLFAAGVIKLGGASGGGSSPEYAVSFSESGLPAGTSWSVNLGGTVRTSTSSSLAFTEADGSYEFSITSASELAEPSRGTLAVDDANVSEPVSFTSSTTVYEIQFSETGLPSGAFWSVTLAGSEESSSGTEVTFNQTSGDYAFAVNASGYSADPASGSVDVFGADVSEPVGFSGGSGTYAVVVSETGLGNGTNWTATVGGTSLQSNTSAITFSQPNGTYAFRVASPGYAAMPASGVLSVAGAPVVESVVFSLTNVSVPYSVARSAVLAAANGYEGGGWQVVAALASTRVEAGATNLSLYYEDDCPTLTPITLNGTVTLPAMPANATPGTSVLWRLYLTKGSSSLFAATVSSSAYLLFSGTGGFCTNLTELTPLPANLIDSTTAAAVAGTAGGTAFLERFASSTNGRLFAAYLVADFNESNFSWNVGYGYESDLPSGYSCAFLATVGPITGALLSAATYDCGFAVQFAPGDLALNWSVTLGGTTTTATNGSEITFYEPNGTYSYSVTGPAGCFPSPANGTATVANSSQQIDIDFGSATNCSLGPFSIGMEVVATSSFGSVGNLTYWEALAIETTPGVAPVVFGLAVENAESIVLPPGVPPATCVPGATLSTGTCTAPTSGWYVALVSGANGTVVGVYTTSWATPNPWLQLNGAYEFVLVSSASYAGTGYSLDVIPAGAWSVSGSVNL